MDKRCNARSTLKAIEPESMILPTKDWGENAPYIFAEAKEVPAMPVTKEFTMLIEDRPGTLGKVCRALADRNLNILGLHSFPIGGNSVTRLIVDNPITARSL